MESKAGKEKKYVNLSDMNKALKKEFDKRVKKKDRGEATNDHSCRMDS